MKRFRSVSKLSTRVCRQVASRQARFMRWLAVRLYVTMPPRPFFWLGFWPGRKALFSGACAGMTSLRQLCIWPDCIPTA